MSIFDNTGKTRGDTRESNFVFTPEEIIPQTTHYDETIVRVLVNIQKPFVYQTTSGTYTGILWDIYQKIKNVLTGYTFVETFVETRNLDDLINEVHSGAFDLCISPFFHNAERLAKVDFSKTLYLSTDTIIYFSKQSRFQEMKSIVREIFLGPLTLILFFGFVVGAIMRTVIRRAVTNAFAKEKNKSILYTLTSTLIPNFRESAYMYNVILLIVTFTLLFVFVFAATLFSMYAQALTNKSLIDISKQTMYSKDNISGKSFLIRKGSNIALSKRYGAIIEEFDGTYPELIEYYFSNVDTYDGIAIDFIEADTWARKYNNLIINKGNFGFNENSFIFNKNSTSVQNAVNAVLNSLQKSLEIEKICKGYLNPDDSYLCIL